MLRTSTYLAIALCMTAMGSASTPAAAFTQVFGGGNPHIADQLHPATASTTVQPSQQVTKPSSPHPPIPMAGLPSTGSGKVMIPTPKSGSVASSTVQNGPENCATNPKLCPPKGSGSVQNGPETCATNPKLCGPTAGPYFCDTHKDLPMCGGKIAGPYFCDTHKDLPMCGGKDDGGGGGGGGGGAGGSNGKGSGHGPVVIFVPQVPVYIPGPSRVVTGAGPVVAAQARPSIASPCGTTGNIPALAAGIDQLLPTAQLSAADMTKVTELRQMIQVMSTDGKVLAARDIEEVAMNLLGYQKIWLRCGLGTFDWEKQVADAGQQK